MFKRNTYQKEELRLRMDLIPKRILQLQLEIDKLKENFKIYNEELNEIINKEQKEMMEMLDKVEVINKNEQTETK